MQECEVCEIQKLNDPRFILYENSHWVAILRTDDQEYLGKTVVSLKTHVATLADLNNEQWLSLAEVTKWLEAHVTQTFNPTHYNWQCLMNDGASTDITHVHWHCTPRYREQKDFGGELFTDARWPKTCQRVHPKKLADIQLESIVLKIKHG